EAGGRGCPVGCPRPGQGWKNWSLCPSKRFHLRLVRRRIRRCLSGEARI
ncbi:uncharacterized protein METZ01_LOCUS288732, partial [marine metagenome]